MSDTWKPLPEAPRDKPVLLFLPGGWHKAGPDGRPIEAEHCRVVGWWSEPEQAWVMGVHPKAPTIKVYPSLWAELPAEPVFPGDSP